MRMPRTLDQTLRYIQYWLRKPAPAVVEEDLRRFVDRALPAGQNLDYADATMPPKELARQVTALANAQGGLLVLGVEPLREEDAQGTLLRILPGAIQGLPPPWSFDDFQRKVLASNSPPVEGVEARPIRIADGVIVILLDVPPSALGVHRAPDGVCYGRSGFLNLPMDEARVAELQGRRGRPRLLPRLEIAQIDASTPRLTVRVEVQNRGRVGAPNPRVSLRLMGARPIGVPSETGKGVAAASRGAGQFRWTLPRPIEAGEIVDLEGVRLQYDGDIAAEVRVACEGLAEETYLYLVPSDVVAEVQPLLSGDEGWEVPPAEPGEISRRWPGEPIASPDRSRSAPGQG